MDDLLPLIGRTEPLFEKDLAVLEPQLAERVRAGSFLVIGGAGSIGQAVVKELFRRNPQRLHVVDISENNMVELVRDLRSSWGYLDGDFRTFVLDCGSRDFEAFFRHEGPFRYVLNLSALKHVRSERDPYTLMHMIEVNLLNTNKTIALAVEQGTQKYFCVSTDKAANPVSMMGASKRIMEKFLLRWSRQIPVSTARFANVAFSDGSLLHGFSQRIHKQQPLSAPLDVRRYFMTAREAGELCLLSCLLGENRDIFFPKLDARLHLMTFADIARAYLRRLGYEPWECATEEEARRQGPALMSQRRWPCYFSRTNTTGEKDFEEFTTAADVVDEQRFGSVGVIRNTDPGEDGDLERFSAAIERLRASGSWTKEEIVDLFGGVLPEFRHSEHHRSLDERM